MISYKLNLALEGRRLLLGASVFSLSALPLAAQPGEDEGGTFELSPFVVEAGENVGYLATSTLAGTRIKTQLGDLGAAISVITPEVFEDTGATDAETILPYALNMEVAGVQGNFADVGGAGPNRVRNDGAIRNNQFATRVRGLSNAILARGLFLTDIPFDSYNTTAITINRGPNSLLFGATTPGGVIDQSVNQAELGDNFGEFSVRIGERRSHRETFDYNAVVIEDRLGVRISGLHEDTNFQQRPTFSDEERIYGAVRAVLHEPQNTGGILGRTVLRGNVEIGRVDSNPPKVIPPGDGITDWWQAPSRELQQYTNTVFPDWVDTFTPKPTLDNRAANRDFPNIPFSVLPPYFINLPYIYNDPKSRAPSIGLPGQPEVGGIEGRVLWNGRGGRGRFDTFGTSPFYSGQPTSYTPGFTVPVIADRNVLDNQRMSVTGTMPYRNYRFDVQSVALEQQLFDGKGGIELAYDNQSYENQFFDPFNANRSYELKIDVMEYLPNLQPNPNLGRAYLADTGGTTHNFNEVDRETYQATAFYELDLTEQDNFVRWFGRHRFTGFYSDMTIDRVGRDYRDGWGDVSDATDIAFIVNDRLNGARRNIPIHVYLTPSLLGSEFTSPADVRITDYMTAPRPEPGDRVIQQYHFFTNEPENTVGPSAPMYQDEFEVYRSLLNGNRLRETFEAQTFSWQSFLFDGNLVGLIGWRKDSAETIENITLENFGTDVLGLSPEEAAGIDGLLPTGEFDARRIRLADPDNPAHATEVSTIEEDTLTWSLVGHLPEEWLELPLGSRLSAHYSESESFVPSRTRRNFRGEVLPPETGETTEYGFTVELFERRLSLRFNWYELSQSNAGASAGLAAPGALTDFLRFWKDAEIQGIPFEDALMTGFDSRPQLTPDITSYQDMYGAIIGLMPEPQRDLYNIRFGPDGRTVLTDPNPGQTAITNADSEGFEIDIAGNITDNWRVILNYGRQETVTSNTAPVAGEFILAVRENFESTGLGNITQTPSLNEYSPMGRVWNSFNVNNLVAARAKDGTISQEQREHRINLVTTYMFGHESPIPGFSVGGALRWQSGVATGYATTVTEDGIVTPLLDQPFEGPSELNGDAWIGYERELNFGGRTVDWKIQFNVRNLIGDDDYIPIVTNPDGQVAVVRNPPTTEFFLTNTFRF